MRQLPHLMLAWWGKQLKHGLNNLKVFFFCNTLNIQINWVPPKLRTRKNILNWLDKGDRQIQHQDDRFWNHLTKTAKAFSNQLHTETHQSKTAWQRYRKAKQRHRWWKQLSELKSSLKTRKLNRKETEEEVNQTNSKAWASQSVSKRAFGIFSAPWERGRWWEEGFPLVHSPSWQGSKAESLATGPGLLTAQWIGPESREREPLMLARLFPFFHFDSNSEPQAIAWCHHS